MAISYVSGSGAGYASRTNTTVTAPTGIADGDLLLAFILTGAGPEAPDASGPAGFAQIGTTSDISAGGFNVEGRVFRKIASSESGNYTFTHSSASSQAWIGCFRGVDNTTPEDATSTLNSASGSTQSTTTYTGLTTVTNGAWIVAIGHDWGDTSNALTPPSGMTERYDTPIAYVATEERTTAGATGNRTMTNNNAAGADDAWAARLVALRPASDGATGTAAITEAGDTVAGAGTVAIAGASAITEGADTVSSVGTVAVVGAASGTEAGDTLAAAGVATDGGAADLTEADDTLSAAGAVAVAGAAAITEAGDTVSAAGAVAVAGAADVSEDDDTLAADGVVADPGAIIGAITEGDDTLSADGTADQPAYEPPAPGAGGGGRFFGTSGDVQGKSKKKKREEEEYLQRLLDRLDPPKDAPKQATVPAPLAAAIEAAAPDLVEIKPAAAAMATVVLPNDDDEIIRLMELLAEMDE